MVTTAVDHRRTARGAVTRSQSRAKVYHPCGACAKCIAFQNDRFITRGLRGKRQEQCGRDYRCPFSTVGNLVEEPLPPHETAPAEETPRKRQKSLNLASSSDCVHSEGDDISVGEDSIFSHESSDGYDSESDYMVDDQALLQDELLAKSSILVQKLQKQLAESKQKFIQQERRYREQFDRMRDNLDAEKRFSQSLAVHLNSTNGDEVKTSKKQEKLSDEETIVLLTEKINDTISECMKWRKKKTRGRMLAEAVWMRLLDGAARPYLIDFVIEYYRENVFTPGRVLEAMDIGGGMLNLSGLECLRKVEMVHKLARAKSILPTAADVKRVSARMHVKASSSIPFDIKDNGSIIEFDYMKLLKFTFDKFGLSEHARTSGVEVALTLDGADISKSLSHVTAGIKLVDRRCVDPLSGDFLFVLPQDDSNEETSANSTPDERLTVDGTTNCNYQSRNHCIVFKSCIAKDSQALYDNEFDTFFSFFAKASEEGIPEFGWLPLIISSPQDMKSHQKCLRCGHGIKKTSGSLFCHLCACPSNQAATPNINPCSECQQANSSESCYHHSVGDADTISQFDIEVQDLVEQYRYLDDPLFQKKTTICLSSDAVASSKDPKCIDYDYSESFATREAFETFIEDELGLRLLSLRGRLSERIERLKSRLKVESKILYLKNAIQVASARDKGMILVDQAIPCILHLENRTGETIFKNLLHKAYANWRRDGNNPDKFMEHVAEIVNKNAFGTADHPAQWRVKMEGRGVDAKVPDITLPNARARKLMKHFDVMVDSLLVDGNDVSEWKSVARRYNAVMTTLRQREDFSDADIENFQRNVDEFFRCWIKLTGLSGVTNYIHMLGSGHLAYYLRKYKNLYKYSQQGWESLNSMIKTFFFHRTQRGGHKKGCETSGKQKLQPIALWLQRILLFRTGQADEFYVNETA